MYVWNASSTGTVSALELNGATKALSGRLDSTNFNAGGYRGFWDVGWNSAFVAGSMGDSLGTQAYVQGSASGLDSTKVWGAAKQALTQGDFIWRSNQFIIKTDGSTNDTGAFAIYNSGSSAQDRAMSLQAAGANALYAYNSAGTTPTVRITGVGTTPALDVVNSGTGEAGKFTAAGNNALELTSAVSTAGVATLEISNTGEGIGTRIYADTGDALLLQVANNAATTTNNALQIEGRSFIHNRGSQPYRLEDAVLIEGQRSGRALYLLSDSSTAFRISGDTGIYILTDSTNAGIIGGLDTLLSVTSSGGADTTAIRRMMIDNKDSIGGLDTTALIATATAYPALFYGPSGAGAGTGIYQVNVYAIDTSGTDSALATVHITARDASGGLSADGPNTDGTGKVVFALDAGTYTILASRAGYYFTVDTLTVSGNIDSTAVVGYNNVDLNTCRVYGYLLDIGADWVSNATVSARLDNQLVYDTCNSALIFVKEEKTTPSGTDGYFALDLIQSRCIGDRKYKITVSKPRVGDVTRSFSVPDSTTHKLVWD
jgi:hypothetical protein